LRLGFLDDGEDLDRCFCNVIEHPDVAGPQAKLWPVGAYFFAAISVNSLTTSSNCRDAFRLLL
jgi:hypothetical protein